MKRIILTTILLVSSKSITYWKEIGAGSPQVASMTLSGPKEGYVVQGDVSTFKVYQMDWQTDTSITSSVNDIDVGANPSIVSSTRIQSDSGFNVVASSETIFRFNAQPGVATNFEEYSVPKTGTGRTYGYPFWAAQTNYMFVSARGFLAPNKKSYRLHSDRVTDVKVFDTGTNARTYGILYGTTWVVVSIESSTQRKLYDYTNGYVGGTNSVVQTHSKPTNVDEIGFSHPRMEEVIM